MSNILKLFINSNDIELKNKYIEQVNKHNNMIKNNVFPDAGFDIFCPETFELIQNKYTLDTNVIGVMFKDNKPTSYYLYPRSSISKTSLRLANGCGIIDSGYRGNLIAVFDVLNNNENNNKIEKFTRLLQICTGSLDSFYIEIVDNIEILQKTERGDGGFGSTG